MITHNPIRQVEYPHTPSLLDVKVSDNQTVWFPAILNWGLITKKS